ncbi:hypothetical protein [Klebsiella pneumoniae]|uniref:hypothetical protein n=1 Tax=Klebsiella pneumoniae TaxID=573 RepID=UPI0007CC375F|nr:hypothetical protein [Klebsiella pneumoniae]MDG5158800.1 hypothetical protein [Klebsiella pneumoniae]SBK29178.1 Uncharacterised protein [Klebsiella pneumoniae]HBR4554156.1 hypothetical protein [Klebsiella pneumoniae]
MADNEKLGSTSPQVLLKNAINLDKLVNDKGRESLPDRFGVLRRTWYGMEMIFSRFIDYITGRGEQAVAAIGWQELGNWAVGLAVDNRQQIVYYNGSWYKYLGELEHVIAGDSPENDGGVWSAANPTGKWSNIGDAALRSSLGSGEGTKLIVAPGNGGTLHDWISGQLRSLFYYLSPAKIAAVLSGSTTDITTELQAAMNDSRPIWLPAGQYYITASIVAAANSSLEGPGPRLASIDNRSSSHAFIIGAGGYLRGWKLWKGFSITASGDNTADSYVFYYSDRQDANGAPVYTIGQIFSEIEINSYGKLGGGWYLQECFRVVISNCGATGLSQPFRLVGSVVQTTIDNFVQNGDGAAAMTGRAYTYGLTTEKKTYGNGSIFTPEGLTVVNTRFVKQDIGVKIEGGLFLVFDAVEADYSKKYGFWYNGGSQVSFNNCYVGVQSNRDADFVGFYVPPAASGVAEAINIRGCTVNMSQNTNVNADSFSSYGVQIGNGGVNAKGALVDGCTFRGAGYTAGIHVHHGDGVNLTANRFQFSGLNILVDECRSLTMMNNSGNGSGTYSLTTTSPGAKWVILNNSEAFPVLSHVNPQGLISMNPGNTSLNVRRKTRSNAAINATVSANGYSELIIPITLVDGCTLSVGASLGAIPSGCSLSVAPVSTSLARVLLRNSTSAAVAVTGTIYVDAEFPPSS